MILLLLIALSTKPSNLVETQHADVERSMYYTLQHQGEVIADIWRPSRRLLSDYKKAQSCYVRFHLGKTHSCSEPIDRVTKDLSTAAAQ